jgi:hypothetical protein
MFERLQGQQIADDLELFQAALAHAVSVGRLPIEALEQIEIQAEPPNLAVRDVLKEVQADLLLVGQRIMSPQTAASRNSLDYDQEQANIEQHEKEHPPAVDPLAMPGAGLSGDDLPRDGVSEAVLAYLREANV